MKIGGQTGNALNYTDMMTERNHQDGQTQSIQRQIGNVQEQLNKLAENKWLSPDEKMKKRKELQIQLQELEQQLAQRQMEKMQEEQKERIKESQETAEKNTLKYSETKRESVAMQSLISADCSMKQVAVSNGVKSQLEGRTNVLKIEIEIDKSRGNSTERKEEELSIIEKRVSNITHDIMSNISKIDEELDEKLEKAAAERDQETISKLDKDDEKDGKNSLGNNANVINTEHDNAMIISENIATALNDQSNITEISTEQEVIFTNLHLTTKARETYTPIDIKL